MPRQSCESGRESPLSCVIGSGLSALQSVGMFGKVPTVSNDATPQGLYTFIAVSRLCLGFSVELISLYLIFPSHLSATSGMHLYLLARLYNAFQSARDIAPPVFAWMNNVHPSSRARISTGECDPAERTQKYPFPSRSFRISRSKLAPRAYCVTAPHRPAGAAATPSKT